MYNDNWYTLINYYLKSVVDDYCVHILSGQIMSCYIIIVG